MKKEDFVYDIEEHEKFFYSLLPEHLKRKYAGLKAMEGGYYGVTQVSKKFCIHKNTVRVGKNELIANVVPLVGRIRQKGGGRKKKPLVVKNLIPTLLSILMSYTAGCPMNNIFWTNLTLREIQERLKTHLISVSCPVINKIMKSLRFVKRKMRKCKTLKEVENRDKQFKRIARLIGFFTHLNLPVLSIDTKKKEMLGNFYRDGKVFCNQAITVFDHDFNSFSDGVAVPHGIYDVFKNVCYLSIGTNKDTAEFVTDNLEYYWNSNIKHDYPNAKKLLIVCDGGGSNSSSHYVVKEAFKNLAEKLQIQIHVAHYPPYCSKWNPIEHRAFSYISKKWQGVVFKTHEIIKELAEKTITKTGYSVKAHINTKVYYTGKKASKEFMEKMPVIFSKILPKWNYKFAC